MSNKKAFLIVRKLLTLLSLSMLFFFFSAPAEVAAGPDPGTCTSSYNSCGSGIYEGLCVPFGNVCNYRCDQTPNCRDTCSASAMECQPPDRGSYTLTVAVSPSGSATTNPSVGQHNVDSDASINFSATPKSGYKFSRWEGCNPGSGTSCHLTMTRSTTVTAYFTKVAAPTVTGSLSVSPTSGTTQNQYTYTATRTGGTATGTITYTEPQCGTGGSLVSGSYTGSSDRTFVCTYPNSPGTKTGTMLIKQSTAWVRPSARPVVSAPTLTGTFTVSPTSGTTQSQYTFTATRTGGTATGTITYTNPRCGTGGSLVSGSYTGSSDRTFVCSYTSAGTKTGAIEIRQGGVLLPLSRAVTVSGATLSVSLAASPTSGTTQTSFTFTPSRTGGNATGALTYSNPQCGTGGSRTSWNSSTGVFVCVYPGSPGTKTASVTATQGGTAATATRNITVASASLGATLGVSPSSGVTGVQFAFTATRTSGNATGTITYTDPQCGIGGSLVSGSYTGSSDRTFVCTYGSAGTRTATMKVNQGGTTATPSVLVTVNSASLYGNLIATPTSGTTQTSYDFRPNRTGGTATGPTSYPSSRCVGGSRTNWSSSRGEFTCTYSSSGPKTAELNVSQGGASVTFTGSVSVSNTTVNGNLTVDKADGIINSTEFNFTANRTSGGTATGPIQYLNPQCDDNPSGWTRTNYSGPSDNTFTCTYSSPGPKTASMTIEQGGASVTPERGVTLSAVPVITRIDTTSTPTWVSKGSDAKVEWNISPAGAQDTAECSVDGGPWVSYTTRSSVDSENIQQIRQHTIVCRNDAGLHPAVTATIYVLPSFGEF